MTKYPFRLIDASNDSPLANPSLLLHRPFNQFKGSLTDEARHYVPGQTLETAINTAIAVGEPLLITGEPGTGKTQAAYYTAFKLGVGPLCHFQVKSDTVARDLLYHFDNVRYFHDAQFAKDSKFQKADYVEKRPLWTAFESTLPQVLLIDEIDKAPRDFPNDLLHELDQMEFRVPETGQIIKASPETRPIVFITSNSERRLPEPFLRRCVYHHVKFDEELIDLFPENASGQNESFPARSCPVKRGGFADEEVAFHRRTDRLGGSDVGPMGDEEWCVAMHSLS